MTVTGPVDQREWRRRRRVRERARDLSSDPCGMEVAVVGVGAWR